MDNALKFDKVARAGPRPLQPGLPRPGRPAQRPLRAAPQGRPQVPEAGRADQAVPRPQGPPLDRAQRGQVQGRVLPRRRRQGSRRGREGREGKEEEEVHRARGLVVRLLQRRDRPDRRRLPDPGLRRSWRPTRSRPRPISERRRSRDGQNPERPDAQSGLFHYKPEARAKVHQIYINILRSRPLMPDGLADSRSGESRGSAPRHCSARRQSRKRQRRPTPHRDALSRFVVNASRVLATAPGRR